MRVSILSPLVSLALVGCGISTGSAESGTTDGVETQVALRDGNSDRADQSNAGSSVWGSSVWGSSGALESRTSLNGKGTPRATMRAEDGKLFDRCGEPLMLRGVNKDTYVDLTGASLPEIGKSGANAVRMVWTLNRTAADADRVITAAENAMMVPILEMHDATGDFSKLPAVFDYWTRADIVAVIKKHETDLIVNIANESGTNLTTDAEYVATYSAGIKRMRAAGIHTPLMLDAAQWGQGVEQLVRVAPQVLATDPDKNLMFSWHEYSASQTETVRITTALQSAKDKGITFVIGEFAGVGVEDCSKAIPYGHLMSEAQRFGVGYLAWSWDNTNGHCRVNGASPFDMVVDGKSAATIKSGWARDVLLDHPSSISKTSVRTKWQSSRSCK